MNALSSQQRNLQAPLTHGSDVEIARHIRANLIAQKGRVIACEGRIWHYQTIQWVAIPEHRLRRLVHAYDGCSYGQNKPIKLNKSRIDSIRNELIWMLEDPTFFVQPPAGINCLSGFIRFDQKESRPILEKHSPDHRCRHVIAANWPSEISAQDTEQSLLARLLKGCFKGDDDRPEKLRLLAEIAGAVVLGYGTHLIDPKAVIFKGGTAGNGKSQVLDVLRGLTPPDSVSSIPIGKFGDERFLCHLPGKLLNACDELSSAAAVASDAFKKIITGDPVTARDVYRSMINFRPIAQHVLATNELPDFKNGMDRGVLRRLLVLTFNRTIPPSERIENIGNRITSEEADLVLAWAVQGATWLLQNRTYTEPKSSKQALLDWMYGADPVLAWLDQAAQLDPNAQTPPSLAYAAFKKWAVTEGYRENKLPAVNNFSARIQAASSAIKSKRTGKGRLLIGLAV